MTTMTRQSRIDRLADLAREADDRAGAMAGRAREWERIRGPRRAESDRYAARLAILMRRAADLAELHADLTGMIREGV